MNRLSLISGSGHPDLSQRIANHLGVVPLDLSSRQFDNNELRIQLKDEPRGKDLYIINSLHSQNGLRTIEETEFITSTCLGVAQRITGVFPWLGYGKSDFAKRHGEAVSIKVIANRLSICGLDHIFVHDLHKPHIASYFNQFFGLKSVEHFNLLKLLINFVQKNIFFDCVAGIDEGSYKKNALIAKYLNCHNTVFTYKYRDPETQKILINQSRVIGNVQGKTVISFDDLIQSGGTLVTSAEILKKHGAKKVILLAIHPDFNSITTHKNLNPALVNGTIDNLIVMDTIPIHNKHTWHKNLIVLDPSKFMARCIKYFHLNQPLKPLFLHLN